MVVEPKDDLSIHKAVIMLRVLSQLHALLSSEKMAFILLVPLIALKGLIKSCAHKARRDPRSGRTHLASRETKDEHPNK